MTSDSALGNQLVRDKLITEDQLSMALEFQQSLGGDLKTILTKLGFIKENMVVDVVAEQENVPNINLDEEEIAADLMEKLGRDNVEKFQVLPLKRDTSYVVLAMGDPNDFKTIDAVQFLLNHKVEGVLASRAQIRQAIQSFYDRQESAAAKTGLDADKLERIRNLSGEVLIRALIVTLIDSGNIEPEAFFATAAKLR